MGVGDAETRGGRNRVGIEILRLEDVIRTIEMFSVGDSPLGQGQVYMQLYS